MSDCVPIEEKRSPLPEPCEYDLTIVIVNMNAAAMLFDCLASIRETAGQLRLDVIIVDNASTDGSLAAAREAFPDSVLLAQSRNLGYVPANNVGLRRARAPITMFLNNDTLIKPGCLQQLVQFMNEHPRVGAVSGQILNADGSDQGTARRFPTIANALFGRRSIATRIWPGNPWSRRYMVGRHHSGTEPFEVQILSSACMVVRTRESLELGGMDEDFRLYWVDAELCSRLRARGFSIWCVPEAKIIHFEGQGGSTKTFRQRLRSTIVFHTDAYHAYTKTHGWKSAHPGSLITALLLASRCSMLICVQLARPAHSTSSGGRN